jgi:hypothetical protein
VSRSLKVSYLQKSYDDALKEIDRLRAALVTLADWKPDEFDKFWVSLTADDLVSLRHPEMLARYVWRTAMESRNQQLAARDDQIKALLALIHTSNGHVGDVDNCPGPRCEEARAILTELNAKPEPAGNVQQLRELVRRQWTRIHSDHPQWTDGVAKEDCPWDECREAREALEKL